jgi:hypothetical protein
MKSKTNAGETRLVSREGNHCYAREPTELACWSLIQNLAYPSRQRIRREGLMQ